MVTPATRRTRPDVSENRAQPPIRWPRPDRRSLGLVALWAVGLVVALLVPAVIVSPTADNPPTGDVILALGATLLGAAVMLGASLILWRRSKDASVTVFGLVPAVACVVGGVIMTASKLSGG